MGDLGGLKNPLRLSVFAASPSILLGVLRAFVVKQRSKRKEERSRKQEPRIKKKSPIGGFRGLKKLGVLRAFAAGKSKEERVKTLEPRSKISKKTWRTLRQKRKHVRTDELLGELSVFVVQEVSTAKKNLASFEPLRRERARKKESRR